MQTRDYICLIQTRKLFDKDAVMGRGKVAVPGRQRMVGFGSGYEQPIGIRAERDRTIEKGLVWACIDRRSSARQSGPRWRVLRRSRAEARMAVERL
jgi:hypothetical protein